MALALDAIVRTYWEFHRRDHHQRLLLLDLQRSRADFQRQS
jgi:hypothetical protein